MTEKTGKLVLNAEKDDFDQQTAFKGPVHWSTYKTFNIFFNKDQFNLHSPWTLT